MITIGLDIGTTSICATKFDWETKQSITLSERNDSGISGSQFEKLQDVSVIRTHVEDLINALGTSDVDAIGISSQMHGILYIDPQGNAVSPLITWQDERGNESFHDSTYASYLASETSYFLATGFGAVTHFYNTVNHLIPPGAKKICTIGDYIQLCLNNKTVPCLHPSHAAAIGLYDFSSNDFDRRMIRQLGMNPDYFPDVLCDTDIKNLKGVFAYPAIGDHQASFLGSVKDLSNTVLINMGTGGQVSFCTNSYVKTSIGDTRPLAEGKYLCSYSALCGGRSYAVLHSFFKNVLSSCGFQLSDQDLYKKMEEIISGNEDNVSPLTVDTRFCGTRENTNLRGTISNVSETNLTSANLILGTFRGAAEELFSAWTTLCKESGMKPSVLMGSGNGLVLNKAWVHTFERLFGMPMEISAQKESAAFGAALVARYYSSDDSLDDLIYLMQK